MCVLFVCVFSFFFFFVNGGAALDLSPKCKLDTAVKLLMHLFVLSLIPDTIELARNLKLIDEIQSGGISCSNTSNLPPVPAFQESQKQRKEST